MAAAEAQPGVTQISDRSRPMTSRSPMLGALPAATGSNVLLVDDDESDNNNAASGKLSASDGFYRKLLHDRGIAFDTVLVPRYSDGPPLDKLKGYSLVLWYTGASYGGNRDNTAVVSLRDEQTLTDYLQQVGGTVLMFSPGYMNNALGAGGVSLWAGKESLFLQRVLGVKGGRGLLQRFKEVSIVSSTGSTFTVAKSPSVEIQLSALNPDQAKSVFSAALDPDGKGSRPVAVSTSQAVGSGHIVYIGFTFENIALGAEDAFSQILSAAGEPGEGTPGSAVQTNAPFTPKRMGTASLRLTGTGLLNNGPPFVPLKLRTDPMTVSGNGLLTDKPPFVPQRVGTPELTITGSGSLQ